MLPTVYSGYKNIQFCEVEIILILSRAHWIQIKLLNIFRNYLLEIQSSACIKIGDEKL